MQDHDLVYLSVPEECLGNEAWARIKMQEEGFADPSIQRFRVNDHTTEVLCRWGEKKFGVRYTHNNDIEYWEKMYSARMALLRAVYKHVTGKELRRKANELA